MNKFLVLITTLGLFFFLSLYTQKTFLPTQVFASPTMTEPIGVDKDGQKGPNPAPPIGLTPCGKTMCNASESCVKYPMETDEHCVPNPPKEPERFPPSCWNELGQGKGSFPPNEECFNHFNSTQKDLSQYEKTCIYEPIVEYTATRYVDGEPKYKNQDFLYCGKGFAGRGSHPPDPPSPVPFECTVSMLVYTDVRDATLGSYGPDKSTRDSKSSDFLAQNYLYSALFERPDNLSNKSNNLDDEGNSLSKNREAYRTYWRLLPAYNQTNLRSFILNLANEKIIDNIEFKFTNSKGVESKTDFVKLYKELSDQFILFWHWPFVRQGCLTEYPVCPEYAQAIKELEPLAWSTTDAIAKNPAANAVMGTALDAYHSVTTLLGADIADAYAAFTPLDFNSLRGYIVKKKDEFEEEMYKKEYYEPKLRDQVNAERYPVTGAKPSLTNVSRESLPYIGAIYQGLLSPKFGLIPSLQPSWINEKITAKDGLSDYKMGNIASESAEAKLERLGLLSRIEKEVPALLTNPLGWLKEKVTGLFTKEKLQKKGYTDSYVDNPNEEVKQAYVNFKGCPLPVSYHLLSPKTAAGSIADPTFENYDDHHQVISIDGNNLQWSYDPETRPLREWVCENVNSGNGNQTPKQKRASGGGPGSNGGSVGQTCYWKEIPCADDIHEYPEGDTCYIRRWQVYGAKHGKALTVLNNPKQTDIKNAIVQSEKFSLYKTLIPDAFNKKKITDASVDAPVAYNFVSMLNDGGTATGPNGSSKMINLAEPINRINNRAQDTMHILQNCWTLPEKLQNSPRCKLPLISPTQDKNCGAIPTLVTSPSCKTKGNSLNLPPILIQAIESAGAAYSVPPGLLIGIMYGEGAFNPGSQFFDSSFVQKQLMSCSTLPGCSENDTVINNIVPFFPQYWDNLKDAVKILDPKREPNGCNLLDGIYALAKDLKSGQNGSEAFKDFNTGAPRTCFGIPLNTGGGGSSSCSWDDTDIETAIRVWELGTGYDSVDLNCLTLKNSCLLGGGLDAICPNGDDKCETVGKRDPLPSHNACVYDVTKKN